MIRHRGFLLPLLCIGLLLEPLGHHLAYVLRLGLTQALIVQSSGSHSYFPSLVETTVALLALVVFLTVSALLAVRLAFGPQRTSPALWWPAFLCLAAVQFGVFFLQESLEASANQAHPDFLAIAVMGIAGQFPLAALAAWLISQLRDYVVLAPQAIRRILPLRLARPHQPVTVRPTVALALRPVQTGRRCYLRRAPPTSL